jgi:hypothetical protein
LDAYANSSEYEEGAKEYKSFLWQLTKARRSKRGAVTVESAYRPQDVREELRARALVNIEGEMPDLVDDGGNKKQQSQIQPPKFTLVDAVEEMTKQKEAAKENINSAAAATGKDGGLRQRKNASASEKATNQSWTAEDEDADTEERKLVELDPSELFGGLPSRELKLAQEHAKKALACYVLAANAAAEVLSLLAAAEKSAGPQQS